MKLPRFVGWRRALAYTVIGVAAALGSSTFLGASVDAWVTTAHADPLMNAGWRTDVAARSFTAFVLPSATATVPMIESRLAAAAADLGRAHGEGWRERRLQTAAATVIGNPMQALRQ